MYTTCLKMCFSGRLAAHLLHHPQSAFGDGDVCGTTLENNMAFTFSSKPKIQISDSKTSASHMNPAF